MKKESNTNSRILNSFVVKLICLVCAATISAQDNDNASTSATETKKQKTTAQQNVGVQPAATFLSKNKPKIETVETSEREKELRARVEQLELEVKELRKMQQQLNELKTSLASLKPIMRESNAAVTPIAETVQTTTTTGTQTATVTQTKNAVPQQIDETDRGVLDFFRDTTINFSVDGNYAYNFNRPYNRLNVLRAYDVTSNSFSLNQANIVIENAPDVSKNRRFGFRSDLQYGQATETLQGNPNNELRPQTYRPVWQAYGTYVAPIGKNLTVDFGKWASALGYETNYTKDNFNYSRSYFFNYLPYYHFGVRVTYPATKKLTATYWLVNGAQQSEDFNESKSQAILLTYKPTEKVILQSNYYVGREQRDQKVIEKTTSVSFDVTRGRITPKGRFHVFDAYATFLLSDKTTLALEGDYVVNRVNRYDSPSRITGGVAYLRHQFTTKFAVAGRGEYLSDRGGLFSGITQALKEFTLTGEYKFAEGFLMRGEYRRDWSNNPYFFTNDFNVLKREQNTATVGVVWWFGRKQGVW